MTSKENKRRLHVNIEDLIKEVHYRPVIWNRNYEGYTDRRLKARMWDEVCESIIDNWKNLKNLQQTSISNEMQKKWRNVKDTFNKEMKRLSKGGDMTKKKYCHFEALSFLREVYPSIRAASVDESDEESDNTSINQDDTVSYSRKRSRSKNQDADDTPLMVKREKLSFDEETSNGENNRNVDFLEIHVEKSNDENSDFSHDATQNRDEYTDSHFVELDGWDNEVSNEIIPKKGKKKNVGDVKAYDEDISFAEMMIPMLRKLNHDQKHFAKVEILNILHKAKRHKPSS